MKVVEGCKVCSGPEPYSIDKLLLLGRGPRFIAPIFGHTRPAVAAHRDRCLVGERRAKIEADLRAKAGMSGEE